MAMIEQFHPQPHELAPAPTPAWSEEALVIRALNGMVHSGELTEDAKQERLNQLISQRLMSAQFDVLFCSIP